MNKKQITKDQHFVPQCYLKQFTINDWKVFAYNKNWKLLNKKYLPKEVLFKFLLYELDLTDLDNRIENFFSKIEDKYSILSNKLLSLKDPSDFDLTEEDQIILLFFVLRLSLGNPTQYQKLNNEDFNDLRIREGKLNNISELDHEKSLKNLQEHNRQQLPISIQVAFQPGFLIEFMLRKKFIFILSSGYDVFLTSDNPVIERCEKWTWLFDLPRLTDTNYDVALSPYVYLKIIDKTNIQYSKIPNLSLCNDTNWKFSREYNRKMFEQCELFVYGNIKNYK